MLTWTANGLSLAAMKHHLNGVNRPAVIIYRHTRQGAHRPSSTLASLLSFAFLVVDDILKPEYARRHLLFVFQLYHHVLCGPVGRVLGRQAISVPGVWLLDLSPLFLIAHPRRPFSSPILIANPHWHT